MPARRKPRPRESLLATQLRVQRRLNARLNAACTQFLEAADECHTYLQPLLGDPQVPPKVQTYLRMVLTHLQAAVDLTNR